MSAPIPTLKTLAAHVASTQQPNIQLPDDLISYLQNYADLRTVLDEHQAIFEEFQVLGVKMASVQNWTQQIRDDLINEATILLGRVDTVLQLFGLALKGDRAGGQPGVAGLLRATAHHRSPGTAAVQAGTPDDSRPADATPGLGRRRPVGNPR